MIHMQRFSSVKRHLNFKHFSKTLRRYTSSLGFQETSLFEKILVANRGEIACRIIRSAKKLGIKTVAIYSITDGPACLHAKMADEAYQIGNGPGAADSYLRGNEVLDIAIKSGSQAIHPGYGFLSENSAFAASVEEHKLKFVGPSPDAILKMGSKSHSKKIMEDAGVPTTPGYHGDNQDADYLKYEAVNNVGFPLLIKATMGGGGKGMRLVCNESEFLDSLESCKRESNAAFGDTNVILERYLIDPRHIEVQVMVDQYGNAVYLHERDCSLQRRHQKVIEEAPASHLSADFRAKMGEVAIKAAKAVGYVNAGTVEFLLNGQSENEFFFCEMNTRLQVEHPVTEMITGQDLVEWQLKVASGSELPIKDQSMIPCIGHSMEARIYAENPAKDFLPATGNIWYHSPPVSANLEEGGVRVDSGLESGNDVSVYYDPMVSKMIVHGENREEARSKLIQNLHNYQVAGVPTNIPFLIKCAQHQVFAEPGGINTSFLEEYKDDVKVETDVEPLQQSICALVVCLALDDRSSTDNSSDQSLGPWSSYSGSWRSSYRLQRHLKPLQNEVNDTLPEIRCFCNVDGSFDVTICADGRLWNYTLQGTYSDDDKFDVILNGSTKKSYKAATKVDTVAGTIQVHIWSAAYEKQGATRMVFAHPLYLKKEEGSDSLSQERNGKQNIIAPMPGKVTRIHFREGEKVNKSDVLIVMESMKMEHAIESDVSGYLSTINCKIGDVINDSEVLGTISEDIDECKVAS